MQLHGPDEMHAGDSTTDPDVEYLISPIVTPLRYAHLKKASLTWVDAFEKDPVLRYIDNNRKQKTKVKETTQIVMFCVLAYWKRRKVALTVDAGASVIFCTVPDNPGAPIDHCIDWVAKCIGKIFQLLTRDEEKKRAAEFETKMKNAISRSLGDQVKQMLYIDTLATEPASQGWGYGGALLESVGALGDMTNRAIWLKSTNEKNTSFYSFHGYKVVDAVVLGDDNPDWHNAPVVVKIMVREPRPQNTGGNTTA
ncbi:hypothetical protein AGABI2DRAFT_220269 [Agaricus bisporus var. bisporus H97]|uniref:hypothetical protein n=1 Tax=Agaricus bisporus var. bisporus (strain H97 / ATCC MYA-4626 / FGSC 10389) TaxID=936046 RepID=UPI00029F68F7|nr:hypothetical protein AGABI2DRAFT_220269 [Agaricus bisporus var. bisporus H97]EKV48460.1 hypothetical protein AGABI2DRAFT_220269 [Agaricus bisporus var. bisporus H97]